MIVGLYAYKDLRWRDIPQIMLATCETTGVVLAIVMTANIFGYSLSVAQIPQKISLVLTSISNKFLFLIVINLFLLFVGCFMEGTAAILILAPILIPAMEAMGVSETQACLIMILNLMIGSLGYTLCSGIICEELNGSEYLAVPYEADEENPNSVMEIGYITRKNSLLSQIGERYVAELKRYLEMEAKPDADSDQ
jgi:hypothetical protein